MFGTLFSNLRAQNVNEPAITRRRFSRRSCDRSVCIINGSIFPVENWSMGGVVVQGDSRLFGLDDTLELTLKFKTQGGLVDIIHKASVVRKTSQTIAFEFEPINSRIRNLFQSVIDDYVSSRFNDTRMA